MPMMPAVADRVVILGGGSTGEAAAGALREVTDEISTRVASLGLEVGDPRERGPHMLGVELPRDAARRIDANLRERGVVASVRGTSLRIAPHLHVAPSDVDLLVEGLAAALRCAGGHPGGVQA